MREVDSMVWTVTALHEAEGQLCVDSTCSGRDSSPRRAAGQCVTPKGFFSFNIIAVLV